MRTLILPLLFILALALPAAAKFTLNPDDNTLWIEDGADPIEFGPGTSDKTWQAEALQFLTLEGGGFMMRKPDDKRYAIGRYLPIDPAYPWFVMEVFDAYPTVGYRGLGWSFAEGGLGLGLGGQIKKGIYQYRPFCKKPDFKGRAYFRLDLHGWDVSVKYMKMVKQPDYQLLVGSPGGDLPDTFTLGDTAVFRFAMPEPAEDVTLRLLEDTYWLPNVDLNGEPLIQLYPLDEEMRVWQATVELKSGPAKKFDPGALLFRFQVLGGPLTYPVFVGNSATFDLTKP